jgi:hypothetical protein
MLCKVEKGCIKKRQNRKEPRERSEMKLTSRKQFSNIKRTKTHDFSFKFHYHSSTGNLRFRIDDREYQLNLSKEELESFVVHFQKAVKYITTAWKGHTQEQT